LDPGAAEAGVQLAALEDPIALVRLGWGDRFRHLEDERQSAVDRLDDPGVNNGAQGTIKPAACQRYRP
jgi:hypothetical protein